jgi:glycerophosphoryl diester phosphodiesterase
MDVHRTADGHIVVAHDPDGRRTALRDERISDLSLDQLMDWNVAAGFPKLTTARMSIPALETVLDRFPGLPVAVDLKPNDAALVPSFLELIRAYKSEDRVTVGSFHGHMIRRLRKLGYRGPTGLTRSEIALVRFLPKSICRILVQGEAAMIPTRSGAIRLDGASFIRRCRSLGLRVDYWVVNDPEEARKLADNGATGIVTDDPRQIVPVLAGLR